MGRNISICEEWYEELAIPSLLPDNDEGDFGKLLDGRRWQHNPKKIKDLFGASDEYPYWLITINTSLDSPVDLFFGYEKGKELAEDGIEFGIIFDNADRIVDMKRLEGKNAYKNFDNNEQLIWIWSRSTLISNDSHSCDELFANMRQWLQEFPDKRIKDLSVAFTKSLSCEMRGSLG